VLTDALLEQILAPPRETEDLPDLGGIIRARPEDFVVEEIPAYDSDGRPGHLLLDLRKRLLTTEEAVRELAHQLKVPRAEIGLAGLKDRDAVTRQRVSVPDRAGPALASFTHPGIELGPAEPHSHKLRRGHLRGNRFVLVVRGFELELELAEARARAKLERLTTGGLRNYYGGQRFGKDGRNVAPGLAALAGKGPRRAKADLVVSAGQSALFNLYLAERARRGLLDRVLVGDILQKRETGGMFESSDAVADQARLDAGELVVTGPMFGSKTRSPSPETPAAALEQAILAHARLTPAKLARLGRKVPGARRQLRVWPEQVGLTLAPECPEPRLSPGLELSFILPPGSYATVLIRELCG
jgi:tRNA pseudouridine13 synthase